MTTQRIRPVTILSGFLGSGKSTLLNELLTQPALADTAVVVNELGDVAIDHELIRIGQRELMITTNGCMCCTAGSDIRASLSDLHEAARAGLAPDFSRVVVETTGLADPAPVVNQLIPGGMPAVGPRDHTVARAFRLAGFVCAVDIVMAERTLERHFECVKQIAFADRIVLTKADLARDVATRCETGRLREQIRQLNPTAEIVDRHAPAFDLASLFEPRVFACAERGEDVEGWLAIERVLAAEQAHGKPAPGQRRHQGGIENFSLTHDEPIAARDFDAFLDLLMLAAGPRLLRLKGLVALADDPEHPVIVQAVQHAVYPPQRLAAWPSADRRTRLVAIVHEIDPEAVKTLFAAITQSSQREKPRLAVALSIIATTIVAAAAALGLANPSVADHEQARATIPIAPASGSHVPIQK
jgi:G3E family GTPase